MTYFNNAIQTKRDLLTQIIRLLRSDSLLEEIDRLPIKMRPKSKTPIRCCVHKDRAVLKYKIMAILGYNISDESDELTQLKEYAQLALEREDDTGNFLTVVDEACSSCVQVNYTVSNLCQGCEARACQFNCPKNAITMYHGKAQIDHQKCINCGLCQKACPYHAIAYLPVPCEESCPVKAIKKDHNGVEVIDFDKCIHCGKCMVSCPFGAIMEKTQILQLHKELKSSTPVVAIVAPALLGQFKESPEKVMGAIQSLGFTDVIEVAEGADKTAKHETKEWIESHKSGENFITSSCCPAYTNLIDKHIPALKSKVSQTPTPMIYSADACKKHNPQTKVVFIGPCLAKRVEAFHTEQVDYVLTFEELGAFFAAYDIELNNAPTKPLDSLISVDGRRFAFSGGVASAIKNALPNESNFKEFIINGITRKQIKLMRTFEKKSPDANFIEVMACEGGCINGPGTITQGTLGARNLQSFLTSKPEPAIS